MPFAIECGWRAVGKNHDDVMGSSTVIGHNYARRARKFSLPIKVAGGPSRRGYCFGMRGRGSTASGDSTFLLIIFRAIRKMRSARIVSHASGVNFELIQRTARSISLFSPFTRPSRFPQEARTRARVTHPNYDPTAHSESRARAARTAGKAGRRNVLTSASFA